MTFFVLFLVLAQLLKRFVAVVVLVALIQPSWLTGRKNQLTYLFFFGGGFCYGFWRNTIILDLNGENCTFTYTIIIYIFYCAVFLLCELNDFI